MLEHYTMLDIKYILGHERTDDKRTRLLCIIQYACKVEKTLSAQMLCSKNNQVEFFVQSLTFLNWQ